MMKYISVLFLFFILACSDKKEGFLKADNAEYLPDTLWVNIPPDPVADKIKIENNAPWMSTSIQGILGTPPLVYSVVDVKASEGGDAEVFKSEVKVRGGGLIELPLYTKAPAASYTLTLKVENGDHSAILEDVYTFVLEDKTNK